LCIFHNVNIIGMKEAASEGISRNKEKSKQKFLDAVGKILNTKGFSGLKVNDIAKVAGLDKKLMYNYFGGRDQLIDAYIRSKDFWSNAAEGNSNTVIDDGGKALTKKMLLSQFDYVYKNKELQKILLWGLIENRKALKNVAEERELNGAVLFENITDPFFAEKANLFRAVSALLVGGIYYLDIYASTNDFTFCGLDLKSVEGRAEIEEALAFIIDSTYSAV